MISTNSDIEVQPCFVTGQDGVMEAEDPLQNGGPEDGRGQSDSSFRDNSAPLPVYHEATYSRNKTLIKQYVNRILPDYPTPTERYYDIRFVSSKDRRCFFGEVGDQCIMFHSNKICLVTLAPTHPVIAEGKTIDKIEFSFDGDEKIDRLASQPRGKRKRGGQKMRKNAPICAIFCSDGSKYIVIACIGARLLEVNQKIASDPELIKKKPLSSGFIAIVQPNDWKHIDEMRQSLPKLGNKVTTICDDDAD